MPIKHHLPSENLGTIRSKNYVGAFSISREKLRIVSEDGKKPKRFLKRHLRMRRSKLVSFTIDPNLDRMWRAIGLSQTDRESEVQKLEARLIECYRCFIEEVSVVFEKGRDELRRCQDEYRKKQQVFGDTDHELPINSHLPLTQQIELTKAAIDELVHAYDDRLEEFESVHEHLLELFDELGVDNRGEFAEIGSDDLSLDRLNRFHRMVKSLEKDKRKRIDLFASLKDRIEELLDELNEDVSAEVREILDTETVTNESIQLLHDTVDVLEDLRTQRLAEMDELNEEIEDLYTALAVDQSDRMEKPTRCTQDALDILKSEVEFLREQKATRLPQVIRGLSNEITRLCEVLKIPPRMRPRYTGNRDDPEEEAAFLRKQLDTLRKKQIAAQPIISLISQIETCKDIIAGKAQERSGSRRFLEEEREKRKAIEQLPKLEKKLLELLVEFREANGYDFEFNGVNYSKSYNEPTNNNKEEPRRLERRETLGQQLLKQMMTESKAMGSEVASKKSRQRRQGMKARSLYI